MVGLFDGTRMCAHTHIHRRAHTHAHFPLQKTTTRMHVHVCPRTESDRQDVKPAPGEQVQVVVVHQVCSLVLRRGVREMCMNGRKKGGFGM